MFETRVPARRAWWVCNPTASRWVALVEGVGCAANSPNSRGGRSARAIAAPRPATAAGRSAPSIAAGIAFPQAAQAIQVLRRTRPVSARTGRKGRWRSDTVYAITDLAAHQARPDELAAWIRGHWQIENGLHRVRDVTFGEDDSRVHAGAAPQVMASLRNLATSLHRLAGATNLAATLRHHARNPLLPLQLLMIN